MSVVTEALPSQATLLTTSAQMPVVTTTEGTVDGASAATPSPSAAPVSSPASVPVHAAANSSAAVATTSHRPDIERRLRAEAELPPQRAAASIFIVALLCSEAGVDESRECSVLAAVLRMRISISYSIQ